MATTGKPDQSDERRESCDKRHDSWTNDPKGSLVLVRSSAAPLVGELIPVDKRVSVGDIDGGGVAFPIDKMTAFLCRGSERGSAGATSGWQHFNRGLCGIFIGAPVVAVCMSAQLLVQPFVWRNWEVADVIAAWLALLYNHLIVTVTMAAMLATVGQVSNLGPPLIRYALAVIVGAGLGECVLLGLGNQDGPRDLIDVVGRVVRWSVVGGAVAAILHLWQTESKLTADTNEVRIAEAHTRRLSAAVRIGILRQQIEPHFLLNTLATIRRLHETDHEHGQRLLGRLFHFMSSTLSSTTDGPSTLAAEIDLIRAYLDVCASRMSGRLSVLCEIPDELQAHPFPSLILATLAENAVKHGIFPQEGGTIRIFARRLPEMIEVGLADDGVGFTEEAGSGLGIANIAERLRLLYGAGASVRLEANAPRGVRASVRIPNRPAAV
jgi:histidine kinase